MSAPVVLDFGDGATTAGVVALVAFGVFAALGCLGAAALWLTGLRRSRGVAVASLLQLAVVLGLGALVSRRLGHFQTLTIEPDGAWRLEDTLGRDLHVLAPEAMRAVDFLAEHPTSGSRLTGVATRVRIELPDGRVFLSVASAETTAIEALRGLVARHR